MNRFASWIALAAIFFAAASAQSAEPASKVRKAGGAAQPANAAMPYVPAIWGMGLGTLPEYAFKKVGVRSKKLGKRVLMEEFPAWQNAFKESHKTEITQAEMLSFLLQLDPYWAEDTHQAAVLYEYRYKLSQLPAEAVRNWQTALSKKTDNTANRRTVIGFLIQSGQINPDTKFDAQKSTLLLDRLNALPVDAIKTWKDALQLDIHQAAMSLVESPEFFDDAGRFKDEPFRTAVETWKVVPPLKPAKPSKAEPQKPAEADPEQVASHKLKLAKTLLNKNAGAGKKRLEEIIKDYQGTSAAKEADDLLKKQ